MRLPIVLLAAALIAGPAIAKEKASFITGRYATESDCKKQQAIDAGGARNIETVPELLTEDGFKGWEGGCDFTKVFEHEPGRSWVGLMVCSEGMTVTPQSYVFIKGEGGDSFDVAGSNAEQPETYVRCDAKKGK